MLPSDRLIFCAKEEALTCIIATKRRRAVIFITSKNFLGSLGMGIPMLKAYIFILLCVWVKTMIY
jgi:hypothetical protein